MPTTATAVRLDDDRDPWLRRTVEALALVGIAGARVEGHLERLDGCTVARAADGTLLGWADADGTFDAAGRRVRGEPCAEWLLATPRARRLARD